MKSLDVLLQVLKSNVENLDQSLFTCLEMISHSLHFRVCLLHLSLLIGHKVREHVDCRRLHLHTLSYKPCKEPLEQELEVLLEDVSKVKED
jgi:hypothetical protein